MKKIWIAALCLLLLSGCGKARQSAALQERYAALTGAELAAEITVHLPEEYRLYQVNCSYYTDGTSHAVITAPDTLAGIEADISGEDLTLSYEDLTLSAGTAEELSPVNCLPWMLRAAASGYVLEEGRETLEGVDCLRIAFDTTSPGGDKVVCTVWFDRETMDPFYCEFSRNGELRISVKVISFTSHTTAPSEP